MDPLFVSPVEGEYVNDAFRPSAGESAGRARRRISEHFRTPSTAAYAGTVTQFPGRV